MGINIGLSRLRKVREGYEISEKYIIANKEKIEKGEPVVVEVRDLSTVERKIMKAIIKPSVEGSEEDFKELWIRTVDELFREEPWAIKPIEEVGEELLPAVAEVPEETYLYGDSALVERKLKELGKEKGR